MKVSDIQAILEKVRVKEPKKALEADETTARHLHWWFEYCGWSIEQFWQSLKPDEQLKFIVYLSLLSTSTKEVVHLLPSPSEAQPGDSQVPGVKHGISPTEINYSNVVIPPKVQTLFDQGFPRPLLHNGSQLKPQDLVSAYKIIETVHCSKVLMDQVPTVLELKPGLWIYWRMREWRILTRLEWARRKVEASDYDRWLRDNYNRSPYKGRLKFGFWRNLEFSPIVVNSASMALQSALQQKDLSVRQPHPRLRGKDRVVATILLYCIDIKKCFGKAGDFKKYGFPTRDYIAAIKYALFIFVKSRKQPARIQSVTVSVT